MVGRGERRSELAGGEWRGSRGNGAKGGSDDAKRAARWVSVEGDLRERHVGRDSG